MSGAAGQLELTWASERCLRVGLGEGTGERDFGLVRAAVSRLGDSRIAGLVDIVPAYNTLLLALDDGDRDTTDIERSVRECLTGLEHAAPAPPGRLIEVPACYGGAFGPDLEDVARAAGLTSTEVVAHHSGAEHLVRFLGFMPGFAYMSGVDERIRLGRLASPRPRVPAGSVGIAGNQTGVYPRESPGGWRLIGRTPRRMFDAGRSKPCLLAMGDRVRFVPIDATEFERLARAEGGGP